MNADEVRFLYEYDRWATRKVMDVLDGLEPAVWTSPNAVGDMSLGGVLVHQLGAAQRWRVAFQTRGEGEGPKPEDDPLPTVTELQQRWAAEWTEADNWLPAVTDEFVGMIFEGIPVWQMLVHVMNHGTQHRAEAAALLTGLGRSPGELDMINYAEEVASSHTDP